MKFDRKFVLLVANTAYYEDWCVEAYEVIECFDELKFRKLEPTRENVLKFFEGDFDE